jgi:hypothetical protein
MYNIKLIASMAQELEITDPIDWGYLSINETEAYELMAAHVVEILSTHQNNQLIAQAALTKLLVENFVLNLKLAKLGE